MPSPLTILLLQARWPRDPMAVHELECIQRRTAGRHVHFEPHNALAEPARIDWLNGRQAMIIGGSGSFSVHDPRSREWVQPMHDLLEAALQRGMPGFGICFGHQLLGQHLGSPVATERIHAEAGTQRYELTEVGAKDPIFGELPSRFRAQTGHSDCVLGVPDRVSLLATNDALRTQAFRHRSHPFWTTQFHPDLDGDDARARFHAYQRAMQAAGAQPPGGTLDAFEPGPCEASTLLGRFVDHVLEIA